jgi:hypothetical protein
MKSISIVFLISFYGISSVYGQTIIPKDFIVSTYLPDNLFGRYNIGFEYFLKKKEERIENSKISIGLNGGIISANIQNQNIEGINFVLETNWYTDFTLPKKWNEYGGLKISFGNFNNQTLKEKENSYFIGITTGIQPIILKKIALKINSDIGYIKNGLSNMLLFNNSNDIFYSGFAIDFNVGLGVRF